MLLVVRAWQALHNLEASKHARVRVQCDVIKQQTSKVQAPARQPRDLRRTKTNDIRQQDGEAARDS
jgi:hypothetical protein